MEDWEVPNHLWKLVYTLEPELEEFVLQDAEEGDPMRPKAPQEDGATGSTVGCAPLQPVKKKTSPGPASIGIIAGPPSLWRYRRGIRWLFPPLRFEPAASVTWLPMFQGRNVEASPWDMLPQALTENLYLQLPLAMVEYMGERFPPGPMPARSPRGGSSMKVWKRAIGAVTAGALLAASLVGCSGTGPTARTWRSTPMRRGRPPCARRMRTTSRWGRPSTPGPGGGLGPVQDYRQAVQRLYLGERHQGREHPPPGGCVRL